MHPVEPVMVNLSPMNCVSSEANLKDIQSKFLLKDWCVLCSSHTSVY